MHKHAKNRVFQQWHDWLFGKDDSLGVVLSIVGCSIASFLYPLDASSTPRFPPSCASGRAHTRKCLQTLSDVPWGQNQTWLRSTPKTKG